MLKLANQHLAKNSGNTDFSTSQVVCHSSKGQVFSAAFSHLPFNVWKTLEDLEKGYTSSMNSWWANDLDLLRKNEQIKYSPQSI